MIFSLFETLVLFVASLKIFLGFLSRRQIRFQKSAALCLLSAMGSPLAKVSIGLKKNPERGN